jgi:aldehyde dehydrogenase (NAD+)
MTWTYAPAPESAALANLQPAYRPFVDGAFVDGNGSMKTVNPATEEVLAEVGTASSDDVDRAVAAARRAYETTWGPMPGAERAKYLFRIARIVAERARELAVLETLDNGKPIKESRDVDGPQAAAPVF